MAFWRRLLDAPHRFVNIGRMASRLFYWLHFQFVFAVATNSVATLGVGFSTPNTTASRDSSSLIMASFSGVATIAVPTFGASLSQSLHTLF
jgi:hypothetical protein